MSKIKLFTHTDLDGIGCAVLAYLAFGEENVDIEYCDYKDVDEKVRDLYVSGKDKLYDKIYITDISVGDKVAAEIDEMVNDSDDEKWYLFDHHATALHLNKHIWTMVRVTDEHTGLKTSGTELFYKYLNIFGCFDNGYDTRFVRDNIRSFVEKVRDYDTWRWKDEPNLGYDGNICKQLNDLFHMYGREKFIEWAMRKIEFHYNFPIFSEADAALLENKQKDIDIYIATKNKQLMTVKDNFGYTCGIVFAERYFSELGNKLSELHPELDYIAMIDIGFGGVSYRTTSDDIDLGQEIAHSFGGGGHRKAAGSSFDGEFVRSEIVDIVFGPNPDEIITFA